MFGANGTPSPAPGTQQLTEVAAQLFYELLRMLQSRPDESRLTQRLVRAKERIRATEAQLAYLAGAVGVCPSCLGKLHGCPSCGGPGKSSEPPFDPAAFEEVVVPFFDRHPELLEFLINRRSTTADNASDHENSRRNNGSHAH